MHSGRPHYHVKAKFVHFTDIKTGKGEFFELDDKGALIKKGNGKIEPVRTIQYQINTGAPPPPKALIENKKQEEPSEITFVPVCFDEFDTFEAEDIHFIDSTPIDFVVF